MKINKHKGFTLIELLVVIAIIGTLSSVVIASVSSARQKVREKTIFAQLRQIQNDVQLLGPVDGSIVCPTGTRLITGCTISGTFFNQQAVKDKIQIILTSLASVNVPWDYQDGSGVQTFGGGSYPFNGFLLRGQNCIYPADVFGCVDGTYILGLRDSDGPYCSTENIVSRKTLLLSPFGSYIGGCR
jgi:prepilin-type N-terminal cleavage/methylation domain-containing protein